MPLSISEKTIGIWFAEMPFNHGNYAAALNRQDDGNYHLGYRFRYYRDDLVGDKSQDEKSWYEAVIDSTQSLEKIFASIRSVCQAMDPGYEEILMEDGDYNGFINRVQALESMHIVGEETLQ